VNWAKIGQTLFSHIRPSLFYLFLTLPPLWAALYLGLNIMEFTEEEEQLTRTCQKSVQTLKRMEAKEAFLQRHAHAIPYFLDQEIESLSFLQQERSQLERLLAHPALAERDIFQERLHFLQSDQNRLAFTEEAIRTSEKIKEIEEKQRSPVQMDEKDLQRLLSLIEDLHIPPYTPKERSPQIVIRDFCLERKMSPLQTPVLEVEMDLLTREFLP
jgi:hypothetical protein